MNSTSTAIAFQVLASVAIASFGMPFTAASQWRCAASRSPSCRPRIAMTVVDAHPSPRRAGSAHSPRHTLAHPRRTARNLRAVRGIRRERLLRVRIDRVREERFGQLEPPAASWAAASVPCDLLSTRASSTPRSVAAEYAAPSRAPASALPSFDVDLARAPRALVHHGAWRARGEVAPMRASAPTSASCSPASSGTRSGIP